MATQPATTNSFNWSEVLPLVETAANATLAVLGSAGIIPNFVGPLVLAIQSAVGPLIIAIQNHSAASTDILAGYGALIGVLNSLKVAGVGDPALLAKINEYVGALQDGTSAYLKASQGFDPSIYTPVTPLP